MPVLEALPVRHAGVVADRYELRELAGQGGTARVWRAYDRQLRRDVAVKQLITPPGWALTGRAALLALAVREARAAAQVTHPNAVWIYNVVDDPPDRPCIVMEYVAGPSLHEVIERRGPLAPGYVAGIGIALLDVLAAAHRVGVLHRDVKPRNVLVAGDGRVVLTDFGIAVWDRADVAGSELVGTPQFVPPERVHTGASLPEGDLWSLGATFYTAVEGRPPYARGCLTGTLAALATSPPDPPRYARGLAPVLCAMLHREPGRRPTLDEARRHMQRIATGTT
jgi:serine/threonine protein kinase